MMAYIVRDSEQDIKGNVSHVCTAKAHLDGTINWLVLDIIQTGFSTALELGTDLQRRRLSEYEKLGMALIATKGIPNVEIRFITMDAHLKWLCEVISKSSYRLPLLGHSLDRDIQFMYDSSKTFFSRHPLLFPGEQRTSWQKINKVCTQRLITACCPNTHRLANPTGSPRATLDQYVRQLLGREQQHNAVSDALDLIEVLKIANVHDHVRLPRENFMITVPSNKVLSTPPSEASSCHHGSN